MSVAVISFGFFVKLKTRILIQPVESLHDILDDLTELRNEVHKRFTQSTQKI